MTTIYKSVQVEVEIDIGDIDDDVLVDEMEGRGFTCSKEDAPDFEHVEHLIVCGQVEEAKNEALRLVAEMIGREFK